MALSSPWAIFTATVLSVTVSTTNSFLPSYFTLMSRRVPNLPVSQPSFSVHESKAASKSIFRSVLAACPGRTGYVCIGRGTGLPRFSVARGGRSAGPRLGPVRLEQGGQGGGRPDDEVGVRVLAPARVDPAGLHPERLGGGDVEVLVVADHERVGRPAPEVVEDHPEGGGLRLPDAHL